MSRIHFTLTESETVAQENEAAQSVAEPEEMPGMSMGM